MYEKYAYNQILSFILRKNIGDFDFLILDIPYLCPVVTPPVATTEFINRVLHVLCYKSIMNVY